MALGSWFSVWGKSGTCFMLYMNPAQNGLENGQWRGHCRIAGNNATGSWVQGGKLHRLRPTLCVRDWRPGSEAKSTSGKGAGFSSQYPHWMARIWEFPFQGILCLLASKGTWKSMAWKPSNSAHQNTSQRKWEKNYREVTFVTYKRQWNSTQDI